MREHAQHSIEAITIGVSNKATIAGGTTAVVAGAVDKVGFVSSVDVSSWCAIGGLVLASLGFLVSVYFQYRRDRRESLAAKQKKFGIMDHG